MRTLNSALLQAEEEARLAKEREEELKAQFERELEEARLKAQEDFENEKKVMELQRSQLNGTGYYRRYWITENGEVAREQVFLSYSFKDPKEERNHPSSIGGTSKDQLGVLSWVSSSQKGLEGRMTVATISDIYIGDQR